MVFLSPTLKYAAHPGGPRYINSWFDFQKLNSDIDLGKDCKNIESEADRVKEIIHEEVAELMDNTKVFIGGFD